MLASERLSCAWSTNPLLPEPEASVPQWDSVGMAFAGGEVVVATIPRGRASPVRTAVQRRADMFLHISCARRAERSTGSSTVGRRADAAPETFGSLRRGDCTDLRCRVRGALSAGRGGRAATVTRPAESVPEPGEELG